jgi:predicted O-methyltransferase YrrM
MISHKDIFGWFDVASEHVYRTAIDRFHNGAHFVEIGAYMGQSSCFMAQEIKRQNKQITFDVVDHFLGSEEHQNSLKGKNLYHIFLDNMKRANVLWNMSVFVLDSLEASKLYEDESLDYVFIDAAHDYKSVKKDITAWLPKVKKGGILSGDDYLQQHGGVVQAVNEIFGAGPEKKRIYGRIWLHDKE